MFYIWHEFGELDSINQIMILRKMLLQLASLAKSNRFFVGLIHWVSPLTRSIPRTHFSYGKFQYVKGLNRSWTLLSQLRKILHLRILQNFWSEFSKIYLTSNEPQRSRKFSGIEMLLKVFEEIEAWERKKGLKIFSCLFLNSSELDFWLFVKSKTELKAREGTLWLRLQFTSLKLKTVWFSINYR